MPHLFRPYADTVARFILLAILIVPFLAIGAGYWLSASPYETDQTLTLDQPVPFSHEHHVGGLGLDCRYCHTAVETSPVASLPPTHTCMTCHSQLYTQDGDAGAGAREPRRQQADPLEQESTGCPTTFISITRSTSPKASAAPPVTARSPPCR